MAEENHAEKVAEGRWTPPIPTGNEGTLVDGFPRYLREPLVVWLGERLSHGYYSTDSTFFLRFQSAMKTDFGFTQSGLEWSGTIVPYLRAMEDDLFANLIGFALHFWKSDLVAIADLEEILTMGSSKWIVTRVRGRPSLVERVPGGVQNVVDEVLANRTLASEKLHEAWVDAFGVNPRPSVAYQHAVIAVEIAALSLIAIEKPDPTLGDVITILESQSAKWTLPFRDSEKAPRIDVLAMMMRLLWRGQASRHGRPDYADASDHEARGAVMLAATLVGWLTTGLLIKSDS